MLFQNHEWLCMFITAHSYRSQVHISVLIIKQKSDYGGCDAKLSKD